MSGIVVGIDQSAHAHEALTWAMREAAVRGSALTVMTVIPAMMSTFSGRQLSVPDAEHAIASARQAADDAVVKAASEIGEQRPAAITVSAFTGYPAQALIDASRDADLVVVGSRGAGGFATLLLGSVSSQVAHHSACPVAIVPSGR